MSDTKPSYSAVTDNTNTKASSLKTKDTPNAPSKPYVPKKTNSWNNQKGKQPWAQKANNGKQNNNTKKRFQGETVGLEDAIFYYGKDMNLKYVISKEKLLAFIGKKFTMSESTSIDKETPSLIGFATPAKHTEVDYKALPFWQQEAWKMEIKRHSNAEALLHRNLSSCYAIIWGQCTNTLKNKIKADPKYSTADSTKNSCNLFKIITEICNRVSTIDHVPTRYVESLYSIIGISGDKMGLSDYYEHFSARRKASASIGLTFASSELQSHMGLAKIKQFGGVKSTEFVDWEKNIEVNTDNEIYANIFMKQAGVRFAECRRDLYNDYTFGANYIPVTVDEAYALLQNYEGSAKFVQNQVKQNNRGNQNHDESYNNNNEKTSHAGHSFQQEQGFL